MESCEAKNSQKLKKVLCPLCCAPSPCSCWPCLLISVRMMLLTMTSQMILMIIRFRMMSIRWHLRAEAKKRLSVDTELAAPFLTQVGTPFLKLPKELCTFFSSENYFLIPASNIWQISCNKGRYRANYPMFSPSLDSGGEWLRRQNGCSPSTAAWLYDLLCKQQQWTKVVW